VNDVISPHCDFDSIRADYVIALAQAHRAGITVLTFTMPDPAAINPLAVRLRDRVSRLNEVIRGEAERWNALIVDFEAYPVAEDPRLWYEDRLHGNELGHQLVAAALAWRLGLPGFDESWSRPLEGEPTRHRGREQFGDDLDWALHYLGPWLGKGIRRIPHGRGVQRKRPVPTLLPPSATRREVTRP
jgi:hypothetical protein